MDELTETEKAELKRLFHLDFDDACVSVARLGRQYYEFPPKSMVLINKKAGYVTIIHGEKIFSGPYFKGIKKYLGAA